MYRSVRHNDVRVMRPVIREQGSPIEVESMRFPIRKTFFNRVGGEY